MNVIPRYTIAPSLEAIRDARDRLITGLKTTTLSPHRQQDVVLAVSELCTNIIRHAQPPATQISVELTQAPGGYELHITDDGGAFREYEEAFKRSTDSIPADFLGESGMGMPLVANLFPRQQYVPAGSIDASMQNRLTLTIEIDALPSRKARIAVVDDDESLRELLKLYLCDQFEVTAYADGVEALKALHLAPVDLVVSDIRMPEMDGFELRRRLARNPATELMPFIFLTGDTEDKTRAEAAGLSIDDYLLKTVRRQDLCSCVTRVLNRAAQLRQRLGDRLDHAITATLRPSLPPTFGPYRALVGSRTAAAGGGDFLSLRPNSAGYSLILGDIMGHGEQAKFFAHAHAGFFVGLFQGAPADAGPGQWLDALSRASAHNPLFEATLVTCLALELATDGTVTIASAGHPAPMVLDANGVRQLSVGGNLPSLNVEEPYEELSFTIASARLFLFTDGLFDAAPDAETRAVLSREIARVLEKTRDCPMEKVAADILLIFDALTKDGPRDDATFVLIEHSP